MELFIQELKNEIKKLDFNIENYEIPDPIFGDIAIPCFSLSKILKKKPFEIAAEIKQKLEKTKYYAEKIERIELKGPYLNIFLNQEYMIKTILFLDIDTIMGKNSFKKEKAVIEFPSPNTNKPLHLGHLRNMLLGNSISRIMEYAGFKVYRVNLNNDKGVHICKSAYAYLKWGNNKKPDKKTDHFVGDYYVEFAMKAKKYENLEVEAQNLLQKYEQGDAKTVELISQMNKWALEGFKQTYKYFNIKFDKEYFESEHYKKGVEIVEENFKKGILEKDEDGNIVIKFDKKEFPEKKVLLRKDGTSVYMTQDIVLADLKQKDFNPDISIYVVASEQNLHFKLLFEILKRIGYKNTEKMYHLSYGMIFLPEGRMKSREGTVVDTDNLIREVELLAQEKLKKRYKLNKKEFDYRVKAITLSAISFFILNYDPAKDFTYDPKESISFEGETGPYIMYTYARLKSIIRRSGLKLNNTNEINIKKLKFKELNNQEERQLAKQISQYNNVLEEVIKNYKPSLLTRYLLNLCQMTNNYYSKHKIITNNEQKTLARVYFIDKISKILKETMYLLNMETLEEM